MCPFMSRWTPEERGRYRYAKLGRPAHAFLSGDQLQYRLLKHISRLYRRPAASLLTRGIAVRRRRSTTTLQTPQSRAARKFLLALVSNGNVYRTWGDEPAITLPRRGFVGCAGRS